MQDCEALTIGNQHHSEYPYDVIVFDREFEAINKYCEGDDNNN